MSRGVSLGMSPGLPPGTGTAGSSLTNRDRPQRPPSDELRAIAEHYLLAFTRQLTAVARI